MGGTARDAAEETVSRLAPATAAAQPPATTKHLSAPRSRPGHARTKSTDLTAGPLDELLPLPQLNVVFLIVGTHGDVLPFLGLAKRLQREGHRVRLATHKAHRRLVQTAAVEFYPIGGDPRILSKWMVESGGTIIGELRDPRASPKKMAMLKEIVTSLWPACTGADPYDPNAQLFIADAIIANPPTFGHIHCAEALGIPLHMMFPQPWTPTVAFPHPMSGLSTERTGDLAWNSYTAVDQVCVCLQWASLDLDRIPHATPRLLSQHLLPICPPSLSSRRFPRFFLFFPDTFVSIPSTRPSVFLSTPILSRLSRRTSFAPTPPSLSPFVFSSAGHVARQCGDD